KDTVISQEPTGSAASGSTITLTVSKGPKSLSVPDVTSQDQQSASSALRSAGFKVSVQKQTVNDPGLEGIVLEQSPRAGTKAPKGSTVTITIGQPSGTTTDTIP